MGRHSCWPARLTGSVRELEQSVDLDGVVALDRRGSALAALVRTAKLELREQNRLAAARIKVQHRAGTLLCELAAEYRPTRARRARGTGPLRGQLPPGTLARYQLTGQQSSDWQGLATLSMSDIEARLNELQFAGLEIVASEFLRRGKAAKRHERSSRLAASVAELKLRAALSLVRRVSRLTTRAEWALADSIARQLVVWGVVPTPTDRPDLTSIMATCLSCGRSRSAVTQRRCQCGGCWVATLS